MAAPLIALAETAQDIGSSLNKFLIPVADYSAEITQLIAQCFSTSAALRRLNNTIGPAQPYHRRYFDIAHDVTTVRESLDYTFRDVESIIGGLARGGLTGASYRRVWKEIQDHFYAESGNFLDRRLEYYQQFIEDLRCILIDRHPTDPDDFEDTRDRIEGLLDLQTDNYLADDVQRASLGTPRITRPPSFERRRPDAGQAHAPAQPQSPRRQSPPRQTYNRANRRGPAGYHSPPMDDFDYGRHPFAPEVPLSPTTSTTTNTVSSSSRSSNTQSSSSDHWLPFVFDQSQPTSPFTTTGQTSACFGEHAPDASRRLAAEYVRLLDMPFENGDLVVRFYHRPDDFRSRFRCQTLRPTKHRKDCCVPLTHLTVGRSGPFLRFIKGADRSRPDLWATLKFYTYEKMILFYCSFLALRSEDTKTQMPLMTDHKLHDEREYFSGEIVDDHYVHTLRLYKDRPSGGVRLQASVVRGELRRTPVWTAFITNPMHSRNWVSKPSSKVVHLNELQRYIFTSEYNPQRSHTGEHELSFTSSKDAKEFIKMLEYLVESSDD